MGPDPLEDTRWALEYVNLGGVSHLISGRRIPEIAFAGGRVTADDGVNVGEGTYTFRNGTLSVGIEASTSVAYPEEALPEHDVFDHLAAATDAGIHGDFLHIGFGAGSGADVVSVAPSDDSTPRQPDDRDTQASAEPAGAASRNELVYRWEEDEEPA